MDRSFSYLVSTQVPVLVLLNNKVMSIAEHIKTARVSFNELQFQSFTPEEHVLTFQTTALLVHLETEVHL